MKIFECKCGSKEIFIEQNGNNTGLYCADCGKWITWLNKDQLRLAKKQIENHEAKIRADAIDEVYKVVTQFLIDRDSDLDFNLDLQNKILDLKYRKNS